MPDTDGQIDAMARLIFEQAIKENRCGELLACLFAGGSATVQAGRGLVLIDASALADLAGDEGAMSAEAMAARMRAIAQGADEEAEHLAADRLMIEVLRSHGYGEAMDVFEAMDKWYS